MNTSPPQPIGHGLLSGQTAVVTAAAGTGIGFATATRCAAEGARVMLSDRHAERLDRFADELAEKIGREVPRQACDVTREDDVRALAEGARASLGPLDVLVNNAGLGIFKPITVMSTQEA